MNTSQAVASTPYADSPKEVPLWVAPPQYDLAGFKLDTLSDKDVITLTAHAIASNKRLIIGNHNFHSLYISLRDERMRAFYSMADYVLIDGMSVVLLGRLLSIPLKREHRATSLDFMPMLLPEAVKNNWKVYFVGSKPGIAERAAARLREQYPGLQLRTHHGYFNGEKESADNRAVLADIKAYAPDVLFVGMGMPRQELWIADNRQELCVAITFPCGAHMDYVAGEIPTSPRWLATIYLEWLYRLIAEPRRLWRRYLVEPWSVTFQLVSLSSKRVLSKRS
jgi:N-acetylglucosaminyldiphosphoundecaprenol N-acetyl-beta-D-mannosaminyltransferase